jgi:ribose 5-phosphate isomerase B
MAKILAIACDHAGVTYKKDLIAYLTGKGYTCLNLGTDTEESVDYPIYADAVCKKVTSGEADLGILICGTGIGMSIAANKHKGIRAGLCGDPDSASLTRQHNNANVLCMGARVIGSELAKRIADDFLAADFEGGRHQTRLDMMADYEADDRK